jgi:hypothetical protein
MPDRDALHTVQPGSRGPMPREEQPARSTEAAEVPPAHTRGILLAVQQGAGNRAAAALAQGGHMAALLARQPDGGPRVSTLADGGPAEVDVPVSREEDPVSEVLDALYGAPDPIAGPGGNFSAAYRILNDLSSANLLRRSCSLTGGASSSCCSPMRKRRTSSTTAS